MKKTLDKKKALVLCGGGSLGAYEVGVYKALLELGMSFDIITGTSIGALNGAMFTMGDFDAALNLWNNITVEQIMVDGININKDFWKSTFSLRKNSKFRRFLRQYFHHKGANIKPFEEIVHRVMDPKRIQSSHIDLGIVTTSWPDIKEVDIRVKDLKEEEVIDYLMASSACYPVFPIKKIGKKRYVDGGLRNNLPIDFAIEMGATDIVAVELDAIPAAQFSELEDLPFVTKIVPTWNTGSLMDFRQEKIQKNMTLGYLDALKAFKKKIGFRYTFNIPNEEERKDLREIAKIFFLEITRRNARKFSHIDKILRWREKGKLLEVDYFIRALELFGEYSHIDYHEVYDVKDYFEIIDKKLEGLKNNLHVMKMVEKIKKGKVSKKSSDRAVSYYVRELIKNNGDIEEFARKHKDDPRISIIVALLISINIFDERRNNIK